MLTRTHLIAGLDALTRAFPTPAWSFDAFRDGHRGAGMIAAVRMGTEGLADEHALAVIARAVEKEWMPLEIFRPLPAEPAAPRELERLLAAIWTCVGSDDGEVHHSIFPIAALIALTAEPDAITRTRIDGLCIMAQAYAPKVPWPEPAAATAFSASAHSRWVLEEFLASTARYAGRVQNFTGHVLTFGCAVLELQELGYSDLARKVELGFRGYLAKVQQGPSGPFGMREKPDPPVALMRPETGAFWEAEPVGSLEGSLAHNIKYSYAYNKLMRSADDEALRQRCREHVYLVLG